MINKSVEICDLNISYNTFGSTLDFLLSFEYEKKIERQEYNRMICRVDKILRRSFKSLEPPVRRSHEVGYDYEQFTCCKFVDNELLGIPDNSVYIIKLEK